MGAVECLLQRFSTETVLRKQDRYDKSKIRQTYQPLLCMIGRSYIIKVDLFDVSLIFCRITINTSGCPLSKTG